MCDIWKGNHNLRQLTREDVSELLTAFKKMGTRQVVLSGGEALLHPEFFTFCQILKKERIAISLLSTGLTLLHHAPQLVQWVDDIIVSLDGDAATHNTVRNIPGAFDKMAAGVEAVKSAAPGFKVTGRTVIHRGNFRQWPQIIETAKDIGLDTISFLPADVSSHAFNRELLWDETRQHEILLQQKELPELKWLIDELVVNYARDFASGFIAESPEKINKIYAYYAAFYELNPFPYKKCNAPWVSAVIEPDGTVRHCFFHKAYGNIKTEKFDKIINSPEAVSFRKQLDTHTNETCVKCVCYLNVRPGALISNKK